VKLEAAIDDPEGKNMEDMSVTKEIERHNLEGEAETCRHFYKKSRKTY
jgi:hypothetical protein